MDENIKVEILLTELKKEFGTYEDGNRTYIQSVETEHDKIEFIDTIRITEADGSKVQHYTNAVFALDYYEDEDICNKVSNSLRDELLNIIKKLNVANDGLVLVAGLGNPAITSCSLGAEVCKRIIPSTNHIYDDPNEHSCFERPVCVISPDVKENTGLHTEIIIKSIADSIKPKLIIAVDSLRTFDRERISRSYQISDAGIKHSYYAEHLELIQETFGIPIIVVGAPLILYDKGSFAFCDVNLHVDGMARVFGDGINMALHNNKLLEDINIWARHKKW